MEGALLVSAVIVFLLAKFNKEERLVPSPGMDLNNIVNVNRYKHNGQQPTSDVSPDGQTVDFPEVEQLM